MAKYGVKRYTRTISVCLRIHDATCNVKHRSCNVSQTAHVSHRKPHRAV